jgi:TonB family protein
MSRMVIGLVAVVMSLNVTLVAASDQDSIAAARDLYASAAYEDALAVLNRLPESNRPADETRAIEQYRALCLLALGRTQEAERAIEAVVAGEPMYRPAADVSPRVRTAFSDVRKRALPAIIQQRYARAKSEFDRKDFAAAAADFVQVLEVMNDPDAVAAVSQPPLADMRTLAMGFKDLAATAAAPPPLPAAPPPAAVEPPAAPRPPKIFTSADADIVPPMSLKQDLPAFPGTVPFARQGMIEVVIDEAGLVESALMRISVSNAYDALALAAARNWRYRPAMLNGAPVKFRKAVQVTIKPTGPGR